MMTNLEKSVAPPNSIIFIADPTRPCDVPVDTSAALVTATSTCICVGTLAEMNGETVIRLATTFETIVGNLAFDGYLETPGLQVEVSDSGATTLLSMRVRSARTHVRVWVNDPSEPDVILIQAR
jgi:hypothetical protein